MSVTLIDRVASRPVDEARVLVFAPRGRDAALTVEILEAEGMAACACATVGELCARLEEGAGAAILTEEAFEPTRCKPCRRCWPGSPRGRISR